MSLPAVIPTNADGGRAGVNTQLKVRAHRNIFSSLFCSPAVPDSAAPPSASSPSSSPSSTVTTSTSGSFAASTISTT
eukprot:SAG11_NODE_1175_length_5601_cov_15.947110_3_plen_77_part_00